MRLNKRTLEVIKRKVLAYLLIAVMVAGVVTPLGYASANQDGQTQGTEMQESGNDAGDLTEVNEGGDSTEAGGGTGTNFENPTDKSGNPSTGDAGTQTEAGENTNSQASGDTDTQLSGSSNDQNSGTNSDSVRAKWEAVNWANFNDEFDWYGLDEDTWTVVLEVLEAKLSAGGIDAALMDKIQQSGRAYLDGKKAPMTKAPKARLLGAPAGGVDWSTFDWESIEWDTFDFSKVDWTQVDYYVFDMFTLEDTYEAGTNETLSMEVFLEAFEAYNAYWGNQISLLDVTPAPTVLGGKKTGPTSDLWEPIVSLQYEKDGQRVELTNESDISQNTNLYLAYKWDIGQKSLADIGIEADVEYTLNFPSNIIPDNMGKQDIYDNPNDVATKFAEITPSKNNNGTISLKIKFTDVSHGGVVTAGLQGKVSGDKSQYDSNKKIDIALGGETFVSPTVTDFVPDGPKIEKESVQNGVNYNDGTIQWKIKYTHPANNYTFPKDNNNQEIEPVIEDILPTGLKFLSFTVEGENVAQVSKSTDSTDSNIKFKFTNDDYKTKDTTIIITAKLTDQETISLMDSSANKNYTNTVNLKLANDTVDNATANQTINPSGFNPITKKGNVDIGADKGVVAGKYWEVIVHVPEMETYTSLDFKDELGKYLNYIPGTFYVATSDDGSAWSDFTKPATDVTFTNNNTEQSKALTYPLWPNTELNFGTKPAKYYKVIYQTAVNGKVYLDGTNADITNTASVLFTSESNQNTGNGVSKKGVVMPGTSANFILKEAGSVDKLAKGLRVKYTITVNPNSAVTINGSTAQGNKIILTEILKTEKGGHTYTPWFFSDEAGKALSENEIAQAIENVLKAEGNTITSVSVSGENFHGQDGNKGYSKFIATIDGTITSQVTIPITTTIEDPYVWAQNHANTITLDNSASLEGRINGANVSRSAEASSPATGEVHVLAKLMQDFDPNSGYITYSIRVGQSSAKFDFGDVELNDYLPTYLSFNADDPKCKYELYTHATDAKATSGTLVDASNIKSFSYKANQTFDGGACNQLTWELQNINAKTNDCFYFMKFTVKLDMDEFMRQKGYSKGEIPSGAEIKNNVTATTNGVTSKAWHSFKIAGSQKMLTKFVKRKDDTKALDYTVYVNPFALDISAGNSSVTQFKVEDILGAGLTLDLGSVKLYEAQAPSVTPGNNSFAGGSLGTDAGAGMNITYGSNQATQTGSNSSNQNIPAIVLEKKGLDAISGIVPSLVSGNDGTSILTVPVENKKAYILEYTAIATKSNAALSNSVSLKGEGMQAIPADARVYTFSSSAFGSAKRFIPTSLPTNPYYMIQLLKKDSQTNDPIGFADDTKNAEFIVYTTNENAPIGTIKCNEVGEGEISFLESELDAFLTATPAVEVLHIKESKAPEGYEKSTDILDLPITELLSTDRKDATTGTYIYSTEVKNRKVDAPVITGEITIFKEDPDKHFVSGASVSVFTDEACNTLAEGIVGGGAKGPLQNIPITSATGVLISDLNVGVYYIKEVVTPSGYITLNTPLKVTVGAFSQNIYIVNERGGKFQLQKLDNDGKPLKGAKFTVYREIGGTKSSIVPSAKVDGVVMELRDFVIDTDTALVQIEDIPLGAYYIEEIEAPDGFKLLTAPKRVVVSAADTNDLVEIVNEKKPDPKPDPKPSGNEGNNGSDDSGDSSTTSPPAKPADNKAVVPNGKIPQTGQLWWPVWLMGGLGSLFLILGFLWKPKKKK